VVVTVVGRTDHGKEAIMVWGVLVVLMETLTPITEVTTTIPTTTTITRTEATTIGGHRVINRRITIIKFQVILGSLVRLEIKLVGVMLVCQTHQLQLHLPLSILPCLCCCS
jgi:hypothetical protein